MPALAIVRETYPDIPVSLDTFRTEVILGASREFDVDIINDITGGSGDPEMFDLIAERNLAYIMMHMQGTPRTMQKNPEYDDVVNDIMMFFARRVEQLINKGVNDIILDPGFGFGKTMDHNYTLMASLEVFRSFELPLLVGISRKSMTYRLLDIDKSFALNGTTALHMYALIKGGCHPEGS